MDEGAHTGEAARPERAADDINRTFGQIVRELRRKSGMTLEQLAAASRVSRAMLSSVERGEKSPTLSVLAGIASGLNVTMSRLMGEESLPTMATVIRRRQRLVFRDPETGIERHLLSPTHLATGIELVEHVLPAGQEFAGLMKLSQQTDKYAVVLSGSLTVEIGDLAYVLEPEDAIYFQIKSVYRFVNRGEDDCRYYVFIVHKDG